MTATAPPPRPSALVTTEWVAEHLTAPHVVLVEVARDPAAYARGHIAGAVNWSDRLLLSVPVRRPARFRAAMERLLADSGIDNYSTVILYGDSANLAACGALWRLAICGHGDARLLDGGRERWVAEGRPLSTAVPQRIDAAYRAMPTNGSYRALPRDLARRVPGRLIVDAGTEPAGRADAAHLPWSALLTDEGTFLPQDSLESLLAARGITRAHHVVTWSRHAAESAHAWFALSRLLAFPNVRNCEGA